MGKYVYFFMLFLITEVLPVNSQDWKDYPYEPAGSLIKFPKDEGRHTTEPVEWWYTIGHLTGDESGTHYSYMLTYFYMNYPPYQGFRIFNVTNDDTGEFYSDVQPVTYALLATDSLNLIVKTGFLGSGTETWKNKTNAAGMIPFEYVLTANASKGALNLEYVAQKPPLILGDDGYFPQGQETYTYYYSQTLNSVTGSFTFNGTTENVSGTSWIDRQYGTFNPSTGEKYEWFCLQLSNGMDINVWDLFATDNTIPEDPKYKNISVYVDELNSYTNIDFHIERLGFWWNSTEDLCYARKWRLTSEQNNMDLTITAINNNTEVDLPFQFYEGSVSIEGTVNGNPVSGKGYAELLHHYLNPEVTVVQPENDEWNASMPLSWTLNNPDDGNPLAYDLYYSVDNQESFTKIDSGLKVNEYYWLPPAVSTGESVWFRVDAYSIDTTLTGTDTNDAMVTVTKGTKTDEKYKLDGIQIFPVPTRNMLQIRHDPSVSVKQFTIYDLAGNKVMENILQSNTSEQISTKKLKPGYYVIRINSSSGTVDKKFLKL
ncbi:lipocalin-like domain-containing protein [Saccharicrinis sp. FJH54]|uniref:lipocalin-like domain-containing protein n=1 Tax=Saccharicrinis sp. FJH54 TaxID=3344665 RepID=UPI0035D474CF